MNRNLTKQWIFLPNSFLLLSLFCFCFCFPQLGGIVEPNDGECHLDSHTNLYTKLNQQVSETKMYLFSISN